MAGAYYYNNNYRVELNKKGVCVYLYVIALQKRWKIWGVIDKNFNNKMSDGRWIYASISHKYGQMSIQKYFIQRDEIAHSLVHSSAQA